MNLSLTQNNHNCGGNSNMINCCHCPRRCSCSKYLCCLLENINNNINIDFTEVIENDNSNTLTITNQLTECCDSIKQMMLNQFLITNNKIDLINTKITNLDTDFEECCEEINIKLDYLISLNPINPDKLPHINGNMPICEGTDVTFTLNKNILTNSIDGEFTLNLDNADDCLNFYVILKDENGSYPLVHENNDPIKLIEVDNTTNLHCRLDGNKVILLPIILALNQAIENKGLVPYEPNIDLKDNVTYEVKKNIFGKEVLKEVKNK